jgi:hypothetical protein
MNNHLLNHIAGTGNAILRGDAIAQRSGMLTVTLAIVKNRF